MFWVLFCTVHFNVYSCHATYAFQSESTLYICLNVKEFLPQSRCEIWRSSDCNWTRTQNHLVLKRTLNHLAKLAKWLSCVLSSYLYSAFDSIFLSCPVRISEWIQTLYLPECQELLARSRREIWRWSDCNWTQTQNHLVLKRTLNHLAKLAKWLNCVLSTYLHSAFDCMFLSCHVRVSWWIHTLYLTECQGTPSSKQVRNAKVKWLQRDSNPEPLSP